MYRLFAFLAFGLIAILFSGFNFSKRGIVPLPSRVIYQFPTYPSCIENIAVRQNGNLLLTLLATPELFQVHHPQDSSPRATLVHRFDELGGLLGIVETTPDRFIVVGGNFSGIGNGVPGTASVWDVDLEEHQARVSKITDIPEATILNGLVSLPWDKNIILIADSTLGRMFRVNISSKSYDVAADIPELHASPTLPVGVNGMKIYNNDLYWTNSHLKQVFKASITKSGITPTDSTIQLVGSPGLFLDDFTFDDRGYIWAATNLANQLVVVSPDDGRTRTVLGSLTELTVAGDTAVAFGRTMGDQHILYISTGGAMGSPVNGTITEAGKVVAVDTTKFRF